MTTPAFSSSPPVMSSGLAVRPPGGGGLMAPAWGPSKDGPALLSVWASAVFLPPSDKRRYGALERVCGCPGEALRVPLLARLALGVPPVGGPFRAARCSHNASYRTVGIPLPFDL